MKTTQILIAGFGGQGVLFAGKFLASAMFKACVFPLDSGFRSVPPKGSEAT